MFSRKNTVLLLGLVLLTAQVILTNAVGSVAPVAIFTHSPEAPIINEIVVFDASASYDPDGNVTSYRWNFGDGSDIITIPDPVTYHTYTVQGNYTVTLTVTDNDGLTNTTSATLTVRKHPIATFTYSPDSPLVGETVTFNASLSTPNGGTITSYYWNFGDETTANVTVSITTHIYTAPGNYSVTLIVTDSEGLTDTCSKSIMIRKPPVAVFTHSPERPLVDETVTFNASLSTPNGGTITSYYWNFGDGANATGVIVTHAYAAVGDYNVTLTITDSEGLADTAWKLITVIKHPVAVFGYKPKLPLVNETVKFDASASTPNGGTIVNYTWNFGDSSPEVTETDPTTTHAYTAFGIYNVTLTITDSEDLTDTCLDTLRILIAPTASFTHSPIKPIVNETVTFNASASCDPDGNITSYMWDFGDGNTTTLTNSVITHAYTAAGTYNVTLTVTDDDGLTDSASKLIVVYTFIYTHDVAVVSVVPSAAKVYVGRIVDITVVTRNEGDSPETFNVTVYYGNTEVGTQTITYTLPGDETTRVFYWNTTGVPYGNYTISATATLALAVDDDLTDNTCDDGWVVVTIVGDANGDGWVDGIDLVMELAPAFNSKEGDANWNPDCDFNGDGWVDGIDLVMYLAPNFNKSY